MSIRIDQTKAEQTISLKNTVSEEYGNDEFCGPYDCWLSVNWATINPSGCENILCQWVIQIETENSSIESTNVEVYCALEKYLA